jgi:putative heme-binding domain-containing protein
MRFRSLCSHPSSTRRAVGCSLLFGSLLLPLLLEARAADPFAEGVRPTQPLSPVEEQAAFRLPEGFEIQLVASEPDIAKPMNMAFDARGRLWVTVTREYPFPVPLGQPSRDEIVILEDFDGSGHARKVSTFADGLNIPIGLYPYGKGVIAWSIPNIWYFQDTDGDGRADKRDILFGPLGWERDTHGMNSSFTRGFDGWLYATHGFNNNSTVRGRDGSQITMNSGNVYRIRLDGSRVEQYTWGQVNPFGLCFDALGNLYSADCHSEPLFQLLRGAYYPSFGKPHDGLGFGPSMIFHSHGSTAISGAVYYSDPSWPEEYQNNLFTGNVMTSVVNRDFAEFSGSTPTGMERPDFVTTGDPWFRPVNLQLGPDGALYIADFYNRIIGHYEVPLNHPGRDRERGRIWRVIHKSQRNSDPERTLTLPDSMTGLIAELGNANLTRRMLAMNQLTDGFAPAAVGPLQAAYSSPSATPLQKIHILWSLSRLGHLAPAMLENAARDPDRGVRTHVQRILSESGPWSPTAQRLALTGLVDSDPSVKRAAADALSQHPAFEQVGPLLHQYTIVPATDTHLSHTLRMALRNQLKPDGVLEQLERARLTSNDSSTLARIALGLTSPASGAFLLHHLQSHTETGPFLRDSLSHIARYLPESRLVALIEFARQRVSDDLDLQLSLLQSIQAGTVQRGVALPGGARDWGADLAEALLQSTDSARIFWTSLPLEGRDTTPSPWILQTRNSSDGDHTARFFSSLPPGGEKWIGLLRSKEFPIPEHLGFFIAGHDGYPDKPRQKNNAIRLREAGSGAVLAEQFAPRNDIARKVVWDLGKHAGKKGYLEVTDADTGDAYAWLAVGRFDLPSATVPDMGPREIAQRRQAAAQLVASLRLTQLLPAMRRLLEDPDSDLESCSSAARALTTLNPGDSAVALGTLIADASIPNALRRKLSQTLPSATPSDHFAVLNEALRVAPFRVQTKIAQSLAGSSAGGTLLLDQIAASQASPRLLLDRQLRDRFSSLKLEGAGDRIEALTRGVTPLREEIQKLIDQRRRAFPTARANEPEGARIFGQACSACHQIDGRGGLVGPQLDGIGNRGLERLLEDVLDPNRNVDPAFRATMVTLKDGELQSGLFRREEGAVMIYANSAGLEFPIPKSDIAQSRQLDSSLMPDNFGEALSEEQLDDLLAFLLSR